ncbi:MAG: cell division protein FtsZ, partial [Alphaproteobacteria bacterium]
MSIKISLSENLDMKPKITVFGVGGAGCNAVSNMIAANLEGVEFWVANTDAQALDHALTHNRIQLGSKSTKGLGAGSHPEIGKQSAEESIQEVMSVLDNANMVFITAGMGGGT